MWRLSPARRQTGRIRRAPIGRTPRRTTDTSFDRGLLDQARVIILDVADARAHRPASHLFRRVGREQVPLAWAGTQNNLGLALSTLGERESGTARLEEAIAAYRAALVSTGVEY